MLLQLLGCRRWASGAIRFGMFLYATVAPGLLALAQVPAGQPSKCPVSGAGRCQCVVYDYSRSALHFGIEQGTIRLRGYGGADMPYDFYLPGTSERVVLPLLAIRTAGSYASVEARTADVAERIALAFDILERDPKNGLFLKKEGDSVSIWVSLAGSKHDFRIMTVSEDDAVSMPKLRSEKLQSPAEVAYYVKCILEAYHELFLMYRLPPGETKPFDHLVGPDEGPLLEEEIFRRAQTRATGESRQTISHADILTIIRAIGDEQRLRLYLLPLRIPAGWELGPASAKGEK